MAADSLQKQPERVGGCRANAGRAQGAWHFRLREGGYSTMARNPPINHLYYQVGGIVSFN
jgi:hypothetical protein